MMIDHCTREWREGLEFLARERERENTFRSLMRLMKQKKNARLRVKRHRPLPRVKKSRFVK